MKSVNKKSKIKSDPFARSPSGWYKLSFFFESAEQCNLMALSLAFWLNSHFEQVYFARYTSATEARVDVYFHSENLSTILLKKVLSRFPSADMMHGGETRWSRMEGPIPCEGSAVHAAAFDFVVRYAAHCKIEKFDDQHRRMFWCDVLHWMHNMAGYDYVEEARCNLYGLERIMAIFDNSIKMGNEMVWFKKGLKLSKAKPASAN